MARRVEIVVALTFALCAFAGRAHAQGGACTRAMGEWVARCAEQASLELSTSHCPPGRVVVQIGGTATTRVEIGPAGPNSFVRAGAVGLSPLGEFPDWSKEPEARRRGLDALVLCAQRDPPPVFAAPSDQLGADRRPLSGTPIPWLLLGALAAVAVALRARAAERTRDLRAATMLLAAALVVLAARALLLPFAFFHQNGHGASWIDYALSAHPGLSSYGPGFTEVFGWAARASGHDPDGGVFLFQALLAALAVPLAYLIGRGVGAPKLPAAALATLVALDPLLARIAQSESYFATQSVLVFAAAAALAHAGTRIRSVRFAALVIAAGLVIAQAARIHPVGWVPLALTPIALLVGPGKLHRRALATLVAGLAIAAIVGVTSGRAMYDVLSGSLGQKWLPAAVPRIGGALPWMAAIVIVGTVALRSWRGVAYATLAALVLGTMIATNMLSEPTPPIERAYDRMFWPMLLAIAAAGSARIVRSRPRKRALAAAVTLAGALAAGVQFRTLTQLPTDAREANLAMSWRRTLPAGARVAYVERSGKHIFTLPLYMGTTQASPFSITLDDGELPDLSRASGPLYYYRSSVCSSPSAVARCEEIERSMQLDLVTEYELPARPSSWHPYASDRVRIALSRRR